MSLIHYVCPQCTAVNRLESTRLADAPNCGKCHQSLITGYPVDLNNTSFDKFITRNDLPVVVDFWASWCPPCRKENPNVVAAYNKYKDANFTRGKGFTIFGVSLDQNAQAWKNGIAQDGLIWDTHVSDLAG